MKLIYGWLILVILLCGCLTSKTKPIISLTNREGDVHVESCSRGCYQFILQPAGKDSTQQFYVTNFPDSLKNFVLDAHNNQKKLRVFVSGKTTGDKQTIEGAGADDRPVPRYNLPVFQVTKISRFR